MPLKPSKKIDKSSNQTIYIYIYEVSVAVKRMYVNNSNCDS